MMDLIQETAMDSHELIFFIINHKSCKSNHFYGSHRVSLIKTTNFAEESVTYQSELWLSTSKWVKLLQQLWGVGWAHPRMYWNADLVTVDFIRAACVAWRRAVINFLWYLNLDSVIYHFCISKRVSNHKVIS
jgi:hypothetical protein